MGLFDSFKNLFASSKKLDKTIDDAKAQAEMVTKMIPGDADDKFVQNVSTQVDNLQEKFDDVTKNIPGQKSGNRQKPSGGSARQQAEGGRPGSCAGHLFLSW